MEQFDTLFTCVAKAVTSRHGGPKNFLRSTQGTEWVDKIEIFYLVGGGGG